MAMCTISSFIQVNLYILSINNTTDVTRKEKDGSAEYGLAHRAVIELASPLSNMGYRVYADNPHSSSTIFLDLKQRI